MTNWHWCRAIFLAVSLVSALPEFQSRVPNGNRVPGYQRLGHVVEDLSSNVLGPFGQAFRAAGFQWTVDLCQADSDGDGFTNGFELGDPSCVWTTGQTPQRTTSLTHPGLRLSSPATSAPTTLSPTTGAPSPTVAHTTGSPTAPTPPTVPTTRPSVAPTLFPTHRPTEPMNDEEEIPPSLITFQYIFSLFTAHAVIMSVGFGLLLPIGVIIPVLPFLRQRKDSLWFKIHKTVQLLFLLLAWIGFLIALFTVAMRDQTLQIVLAPSPTVHGPLGIALIVIISVQSFVGIFRPHLTEVKSVPRRVFEFIHPFIGRSVVVLAAVQMFFGFRLLTLSYIFSEAKQNSIMTWAYFQAIFTPILVALVVVTCKIRSGKTISIGGANTVPPPPPPQNVGDGSYPVKNTQMNNNDNNSSNAHSSEFNNNTGATMAKYQHQTEVANAGTQHETHYGHTTSSNQEQHIALV